MNTTELENRRRNITTLVTTYYKNNPFLERKHIGLNDLISTIMDKYLDSDLSIEEIEQELINEIYRLKNELPKLVNSVSNEKQNETTGKSKFDSVLKDFNKEGIDYKIDGSSSVDMLLGELKINTLSLWINDKDVNKAKAIFKKYGPMYFSSGSNSNKKIKNGNIIDDSNNIIEDDNNRVCTKEFERLDDGSIITKDYFTDSNGTECIKADFYGKDLAKEIFDTDKVSANGEEYPIVTPEFEYISRLNSTNEQDMEIVSKLEPIVDNNRINKIQELAANNYVSQITKAPQVKEQNNELSSMMENTEESVNTNVNNDTQQIEKPKQFVKTSPQSVSENNGGYVSKLAFIFFLLLIIVLFLTGFLLLNM